MLVYGYHTYQVGIEQESIMVGAGSANMVLCEGKKKNQ